MFEGVEMQVVESAAVWLKDGTPVRLVFRGQRYRVLDTPTRLEDELAWITHPPAIIDGWRMTATADDGSDSVVIDVRYDSTTRSWLVTGIYA